MSDNFTFEFCCDTIDQASEIEGMTYGIKLDYNKVKAICQTCEIRARVFKNGQYYQHIFEDGKTG